MSANKLVSNGLAAGKPLHAHGYAITHGPDSGAPSVATPRAIELAEELA